jgi:predicted small metal-binding protein
MAEGLSAAEVGKEFAEHAKRHRHGEEHVRGDF